VTATTRHAVQAKIDRNDGQLLPDPVCETLDDRRTLAAVGTGSPVGFAAHCERMGEASRQRGPAAVTSFAGMVVGPGEAIVQWYGGANVYFLDSQSLRLLSFDDGLFGESDGDDDRFLSLFVQPPEPGVFVAFTPSAWECWAAPWVLEKKLLEAFRDSDSWDAWTAAVKYEITQATGDSAAFVAVPCLANSFEELRDILITSLLTSPAAPPEREVEHQAPLAPAAVYNIDHDAATPIHLPEPEVAVLPQSPSPLWGRAALFALATIVGLAFSDMEGTVSASADAPAGESTTQADAPEPAAAPAPAPAPVIRAPETRVAASELRRSRLSADDPTDLLTPRRPAQLAFAVAPRRAPAVHNAFRYRARVRVIMRAKAGPKQRRIATLEPETVVNVIGRRRGDFWVKVRYGDLVGWIAPIRGYLRPMGKFSLWDIPPL